MGLKLPSIIFITGTDGAGKSFLSGWLVDRLCDQGIKAIHVWTRFNNLLSKPFLAFTRLTRHNHYKLIDGTRFGFHNFENLGPLRYLFLSLQCADVNIAAYRDITLVKKQCDVIVCERGPWDTLADVMADTGLSISPASRLGRLFTAQVASDAMVLFIKRSKNNILSTRPELVHDYKMDKKISIYQQLAKSGNWQVIDNNGRIEETKITISNLLNI